MIMHDPDRWPQEHLNELRFRQYLARILGLDPDLAMQYHIIDGIKELHAEIERLRTFRDAVLLWYSDPNKRGHWESAVAAFEDALTESDDE